jgi:hypothetical protein
VRLPPPPPPLPPLLSHCVVGCTIERVVARGWDQGQGLCLRHGRVDAAS